MSEAQIAALDHVVIVVADLDAATENYATILGRSPSWRGSHPGEGTENSLFRLDNTYLELIAPTSAGATADILRYRLSQQGEGGGEGLVALAFQARDLDRFCADLATRGVECSPASPGSGSDRDTGAERTWRSAWVPGEATRGVLMFAIAHESGDLPTAAPTAPGGETVDGLDHVVVMSTDVDATRAVYGDTLGLRLALDRHFPERDVRLLFFRVGGLTVEIGGAPTPAAPEEQLPDRLWGVAYRAADLDAAHARLRAAGVDVSDVRSGHKRGTRVCTVRSGTHGVATLLIGPDAENA